MAACVRAPDTANDQTLLVLPLAMVALAVVSRLRVASLELPELPELPRPTMRLLGVAVSQHIVAAFMSAHARQRHRIKSSNPYCKLSLHS